MMLRGSLGLESRGGSGSHWTGTGCPASCSLLALPLRTLCPQPGPHPPAPGPLGIGQRARPMECRLLPLACSGASPPMAARRARRSLPRVPAPGPALTPPKTLAPLLPAGQRAVAAPPRRLGASQPLWFSSTLRRSCTRTMEGTGSSPSWPAADQPLHPSPPGLQRAQMLRWKPREHFKPTCQTREACTDTCQVSLPCGSYLWV